MSTWRRCGTVLALLLPVTLQAQQGTGEEHAHDHVHDHAAAPAIPAHEPPASANAPRVPVPPLTAADRAAAVAPAGGHAAHDDAIHSQLMVERLEWNRARSSDALAWDAEGWIGTDLNRIWLRSHGERSGGTTHSARLEILHGHSFATWWDALLGLRHDPAPGPSRTFVALGVQGLAPHWLETRLTAYARKGSGVGGELQVEYELLLSNRLVLQPLAGLSWWSRGDAARNIGSGLGSAEAGLRLRYEITRRIAPYVGVSHERAFGSTRELRRAASGHSRQTAVVAGLRFWF